MHDYVILYNSVCTSVAIWFLCANQYLCTCLLQITHCGKSCRVVVIIKDNSTCSIALSLSRKWVWSSNQKGQVTPFKVS